MLKKVFMSIKIRLKYTTKNGNITGRLGEVVFVFSDDETVSIPVKAKAFLVDNSNIPFLIGFEDILTSISLFSDFAANSAFIVQK